MNNNKPFIEYPHDMETEVVLRSFVALLNPAINSTEGWIKLLNHPIEEVDDDEIKANILQNISGIKSLLVEVKNYIDTKSSE